MIDAVTERKLLLRLNKYNDSWRMDAENFSLFQRYVENYFKNAICLYLSEDQGLMYAEIAEVELMKILPLFGTFSPDKETLILAMVFQGYDFRPVLENSFAIRLCMKTNNDSTRDISIMLKLK
ncbi:hypothetical protein [Bacteroides sedimenti]|uniref:Uncharacterized protein n=1 Tax=Bacteroides sedimenti TaxID=2136147 RepID=A0ABM8IBK2_9BACE